MNSVSWINDVIGKPWEDRATGPDTYDCWGLVVDSFKRLDGIELPSVDGYDSGSPIEVSGAAEELNGDWVEIPSAEHLCVFCVYSDLGSMIHVGRVVEVRKAGLYAIHSRGEGGQVKADALRVIKRAYSNIKYFKRVV